MTILAAASDVHSFLNMMDTSVRTNLLVSNLSKLLCHDASTSAENAFNLFGCTANGSLAKPLVIPVADSPQLIVNFKTAKQHFWYRQDNRGAGDGRKLFKFLNSSGQLLFSIGFDSATALMRSSGLICIFTYDSAGTQLSKVTTTLDMMAGLNFYNSGGTTPQTSYKNINISANIDVATPVNSYIRIYKDSYLCGELAGSACITNENPLVNSIKVRDNITTPPISGDISTYISELIVSNTLDFSLRAYTLKPGTLTAGNQFTGVVTSIQGVSQDKNYIASAAELNTKAEFSLIRSPNLYGNSGIALSEILHKIKNLDIYYMGRYIQAGGVSVTIGGSLSNDTTTIIPQVTDVIAANAVDDYYLTKKLVNYPTDLQPSVLTNIKATFELLGV